MSRPPLKNKKRWTSDLSWIIRLVFWQIMGYELFYPYKLGPIRLDPWGGSFVIHLMGKLRRFYLVYFRKEYVKKQLASRKGECLQCAQCCSFVFVCPMLTRQRSCRTYNKFRLEMCRSFPIDQRDIDEVTRCGGTCGYRFEEQSLHHPPTHTRPKETSQNRWKTFQAQPRVAPCDELTAR